MAPFLEILQLNNFFYSLNHCIIVSTASLWLLPSMKQKILSRNWPVKKELLVIIFWFILLKQRFYLCLLLIVCSKSIQKEVKWFCLFWLKCICNFKTSAVSLNGCILLNLGLRMQSNASVIKLLKNIIKKFKGNEMTGKAEDSQGLSTAPMDFLLHLLR